VGARIARENFAPLDLLNGDYVLTIEARNLEGKVKLVSFSDTVRSAKYL